MTSVTFFKSGSEITGFEIKGHSGFASEGEDIVCSAISSAAIMAANTVTEIVGDKADITEDDGYLRFESSSLSGSSHDILRGLEIHLKQISEQYPSNIKINYGGNTDA